MSEREQFEAWAMQFNPQLLINFGRGPTVRGQIAWEAWQAARAQPAQAGQVLTDEDVAHIWQHFGKSGASSIDSVELTRAIEQAVLAKRAPMTPKTLTLEQCVTFAKVAGIKLSPAQFSGVLEAEVSEFELQTFANLCIGIVGEKGGA